MIIGRYTVRVSIPRPITRPRPILRLSHQPFCNGISNENNNDNENENGNEEDNSIKPLTYTSDLETYIFYDALTMGYSIERLNYLISTSIQSNMTSRSELASPLSGGRGGVKHYKNKVSTLGCPK